MTGQLDNTARLGQVRKDMARINTILREREIAAAELEASLMSDAAATTEHHRRGRPTPAQPPQGRARALVVSTTMDKTIVVSVVDRVRHPRYDKTVQRTKRLYVHDEDNDARDGDRVRVQETRPLSKLKRWRLVEVLERAR